MITIYGKGGCSFCVKAREFCEERNFKYKYLVMGVDYSRDQFFEIFPSAKTVPQIVINRVNVGGYNEMLEYVENTAYTGTGHSL